MEKDFNKTSFSDIKIGGFESCCQKCTLCRMCLRLIYSGFLSSSPVGGVLFGAVLLHIVESQFYVQVTS